MGGGGGGGLGGQHFAFFAYFAAFAESPMYGMHPAKEHNASPGLPRAADKVALLRSQNGVGSTVPSASRTSCKSSMKLDPSSFFWGQWHG